MGQTGCCLLPFMLFCLACNVKIQADTMLFRLPIGLQRVNLHQNARLLLWSMILHGMAQEEL